MKYTVNYFIKKFTQIPAKKWATRTYHKPGTGIFCALGHCGIYTEEAESLRRLIRNHTDYNIVAINDGYPVVTNFKQKTPRGRVLAALNYIKGKK